MPHPHSTCSTRGGGRGAWIWGVVVVVAGTAAYAQDQDQNFETAAISCSCPEPIAQAVANAFLANPDGGPALSEAIRTITARDPALIRDVVCQSQASSAEAAYAAGAGLALAGHEADRPSEDICCSTHETLSGYFETTTGGLNTTSVPQCLERAARERMTRLLSPNLTGLGSAGGAGGMSGAGGSTGVVTPAVP